MKSKIWIPLAMAMIALPWACQAKPGNAPAKPQAKRAVKSPAAVPLPVEALHVDYLPHDRAVVHWKENQGSTAAQKPHHYIIRAAKAGGNAKLRGVVRFDQTKGVFLWFDKKVKPSDRLVYEVHGWNRDGQSGPQVKAGKGTVAQALPTKGAKAGRKGKHSRGISDVQSAYLSDLDMTDISWLDDDVFNPNQCPDWYEIGLRVDAGTLTESWGATSPTGDRIQFWDDWGPYSPTGNWVYYVRAWKGDTSSAWFAAPTVPRRH